MMCVLIMKSVMFVFFFFFKQKTAYEMRISDWSSDVCSSDLGVGGAAKTHLVVEAHQLHVVAGPEAAVHLDAPLRHDEQRDALDPGRRARDAGQHHMDDVFGQLVLAGREDRKSTRLNSSH